MPLTQIFAQWRHIIFFILLSAMAFFLLIFFSHVSFIMEVFSGGAGLHGTGIKLFTDAWYWSLNDLSPLQLMINILAALLFGMNVMTILHVVRIYKAAFVSAVSLLSMGGFISALMGLLCISCGSLLVLLIPSIFSISFLWLPFHGFEFSILSIILLSASLWVNYKKLSLSAGK